MTAFASEAVRAWAAVARNHHAGVSVAKTGVVDPENQGLFPYSGRPFHFNWPKINR